MPRGYGEDLAYIHDAGHGDFARRAAPAVLKMLRRAGIGDGLVVDLGCGSGIWARALTGAGYNVLGVDQSAEMLRIARRHAPLATFRRGSLFEIELPRCAAVTAMGECFNYLFDRSSGPRALARLFRRIHGSLRPGGLLIFDVATPGRGGGRGARQKNVHGRDWAILLETEEDPRACTLTRRIVSFRRVGTLYRRSEEIHRLRLYGPGEITRELRRVGFRVRVLRGYGPVRLPRGWAAFAARKPAARKPAARTAARKPAAPREVTR
jgi:SAM-dependent methyltransferase